MSNFKQKENKMNEYTKDVAILHAKHDVKRRYARRCAFNGVGKPYFKEAQPHDDFFKDHDMTDYVTAYLAAYENFDGQEDFV